MKWPEIDKCICGSFPQMYHIENTEGDISCTYCECKVCEIATYYNKKYDSFETMEEKTLIDCIKFWNGLVERIREDMAAQ